MRFEATDEQRGFADALSDMLSRAGTADVARAWAAGDHEPGRRLWHRLADQGVCALVVPERAGGLGGTDVDLVVAHETLGRHLAVGPWIESTAYLPGVLSDDALGRLAEGAMATVALPPVTPYALDADAADEVYLGDRPATVGEPIRSVDTTRRLFRVGTEGQDASPDSDAVDRAVLACSAQLLGCGERLLDDSVEYVKQRKQFGRPIGSYQAIKHRLADVRIALDFARPLLHAAALGEVPASAAKVVAGDAAYLAARVGLQLHGAIGYTAELDLGLWFARVRALVGAWGDPDHHRALLAEHVARPTAGRR
jgi:alkylation response protein AidB-like acyl-CoA dehydrogenase